MEVWENMKSERQKGLVCEELAGWGLWIFLSKTGASAELWAEEWPDLAHFNNITVTAKGVVPRSGEHFDTTVSYLDKRWCRLSLGGNNRNGMK